MTHSWLQYISNEPLDFFKLASSLFIFSFQNKKIEYIFISSKNNCYLQKEHKLLGDETNIEPSKYGYYSGVYPFWFKVNL